MDQHASPIYETWCRTHACQSGERPCLQQRIKELEAALDDIHMHGVDGPTSGWVMVPKCEWEQAFKRADLQKYV